MNREQDNEDSSTTQEAVVDDGHGQEQQQIPETVVDNEHGQEQEDIEAVIIIVENKDNDDRIPSTTPGAEPPRDAKDSGSARSHPTHLETSSSNRP